METTWKKYEHVTKKQPRTRDKDLTCCFMCAYRDVMWFHSFWYRRYVEGNMDVVLEILKEIKENYK